MTNAEIIAHLLTKYEPADVPGYARQHHDIIVSHERVREIFRATGFDANGRSKALRLGNPPLPVPEDFVIHAAAEFNPALAERYGVGVSTITRWRRETSIRPPEHRGPRPVPQGFASCAIALSNKELGERFTAGSDTIHRWLREAGIPRVGRQARISPSRFSRGIIAPAPVTHRDMSRGGLAAAFLQRFGPIHRCDETGKTEPTGTHWRRGLAILTDAEVIDRALRNGWQPDAWRTVTPTINQGARA